MRILRSPGTRPGASRSTSSRRFFRTSIITPTPYRTSSCRCSSGWKSYTIERKFLSRRAVPYLAICSSTWKSFSSKWATIRSKWSWGTTSSFWKTSTTKVSSGKRCWKRRSRSCARRIFICLPVKWRSCTTIWRRKTQRSIYRGRSRCWERCHPGRDSSRGTWPTWRSWYWTVLTQII